MARPALSTLFIPLSHYKAPRTIVLFKVWSCRKDVILEKKIGSPSPATNNLSLCCLMLIFLLLWGLFFWACLPMWMPHLVGAKRCSFPIYSNFKVYNWLEQWLLSAELKKVKWCQCASATVLQTRYFKYYKVHPMLPSLGREYLA